MEFHPHPAHPGVLLAVADQHLDAYECDGLVADLLRALDTGAHGLVVDCQRVGHVSTIAVCALVRLHKRLAAHGRALHLAAVQPPLRRVLGMTRLDTVFRRFELVDEAVRAAADELAVSHA